MHRMTCRNGFVFAAAIGLGAMVMSARGGSLDSPAGPDSPLSAMFTLNDIYNQLNTWTNITKRTGAFTEPTAGPTNGTMHTLDEIMTLVTNPNRMPVGKTGQTNLFATYDDGASRIGVAWPNPRFAAVATTGDETNQIRDNLTGLIWARNANISGPTNWGAAVTNCNSLTYGGTNDWRLPNWQELRSLIDASKADPALPAGHPFASVQLGYYWSSTTIADNTGYACGT